MVPRAARLLHGALLAAALAAPWGAAPAAAQTGFVVIVNESNPLQDLSRQQLADIFMRRMTTWPGGGSIHPVDLPAVSETRDAFSRAVHGRPAAAVASYWGQQVFAGRAVPPPQRPTDRAVVEFVRGDAASIGYVAPGSATVGVKTVAVY